MDVFGLPIVKDERCLKLVYCYPRTKKKRIRNKWKKYRFKRVPSKEALIFHNRIVCHPTMYRELKKAMRDANETNK